MLMELQKTWVHFTEDANTNKSTKDSLNLRE